MTSDLILGPMAPSMPIFDHKLQPMARGTDRMTLLLDAIDRRVQPPEFRYLRAELPPLESFDAARTFERGGSPESRWFVVSQRFRQAWLGAGLRAEWIPVRIEDGGAEGIQ